MSTENVPYMDPSKINLILDLDNTIISTFKMKKDFETEEEFHTYNRDVDIINKNLLEYVRMPGTNFIIFIRPGLKEFLKYVFDNFNVSVWTAGTSTYGDFIIKNIIFKHIPSRNIYYLHADDCALSSKIFPSSSPKDLRYLYYIQDRVGGKSSFYPCNTIIMDDNPHVMEANPLQTIKAKYFEVKSPDAKTDNFLLTDAIYYLQRIKRQFEQTPCIAHVSISKFSTTYMVENPRISSYINDKESNNTKELKGF